MVVYFRRIESNFVLIKVIVIGFNVMVIDVYKKDVICFYAKEFLEYQFLHISTV